LRELTLKKMVRVYTIGSACTWCQWCGKFRITSLRESTFMLPIIHCPTHRRHTEERKVASITRETRIFSTGGDIRMWATPCELKHPKGDRLYT
jgi:hypothetical protein